MPHLRACTDTYVKVVNSSIHTLDYEYIYRCDASVCTIGAVDVVTTQNVQNGIFVPEFLLTGQPPFTIAFHAGTKWHIWSSVRRPCGVHARVLGFQRTNNVVHTFMHRLRACTDTYVKAENSSVHTLDYGWTICVVRVDAASNLVHEISCPHA